MSNNDVLSTSQSQYEETHTKTHSHTHTLVPVIQKARTEGVLIGFNCSSGLGGELEHTGRIAMLSLLNMPPQCVDHLLLAHSINTPLAQVDCQMDLSSA